MLNKTRYLISILRKEKGLTQQELADKLGITDKGYTVKKGLMEVTRKYFKKHKIVVDKIIFRTIDKVDACIENKIDLMIDDSIKVLEDLDNNGINTILFSTISNKNYKTNLVRVDNWLDLEKYIENFANNIETIQ